MIFYTHVEHSPTKTIYTIYNRTGSIQFNSKNFIIPQGAILLWSWRTRKKQQQKTHKVKRTIQQTQHHQQKSLTLTII